MLKLATMAEPMLLGTLIFLLLAALATAVVVLRTPIRLLELRTRMAETELRLEAIDAAHKKAVRRWGIEAKKSSPKSPSPPDVIEELLDHSDAPGQELLDFASPAGYESTGGAGGTGLDPLSRIRAQLRAKNGQ